MQDSFSVLVWGKTYNCTEQFGKMLGIFQAYLGGNVGQRQIRVQHQVDCLVDTVDIDVI